MELKRTKNGVVEFTFSSDELLKALLPRHKDLTLTSDSSCSLNLSILGISEKEYLEMEWQKKFKEYVCGANRKITPRDISKEALLTLNSLGIYTVRETIVASNLPKLMLGGNFTKEVVSEVKMFTKIWNSKVTELISQRKVLGLKP